MKEFKIGYHFCTKEFYNKLKEKQEIKADDRNCLELNLSSAYKYLFKEKMINNGNGMFFLWGDKKNKGTTIKYCNENEASHILLELRIPADICIDTNYENWCSFIMDLEEADGDYQLADEICREDFGIKDGLEGSYNNIYDISGDKDILQILIPYIKYDWIESLSYVENKVV